MKLPELSTAATQGEWYLIRKGGYWYRPNAQGYAYDVRDAGRYTLEDAERLTHPNGPNGPRDGLSFIAEAEALSRTGQLVERAGVVEARSALALGDRVEKIKGSCWTGRVVGFYRTELTPYGVCVESEREPGSVQIYPEAALKIMWCDEAPRALANGSATDAG